MKRLFCGIIALLLLAVLLPITLVQADTRTVSVGVPVEEHPELFISRSLPTHGQGKLAIFLIDFPDCPNDNPVATREYYDKLYFSGGTNTNWDEYYSSVADFYEKQSCGKLKLSGQVFDWYTAKHERSYYDQRKAELVKEAIDYYRAKGVDFAQFDGNSDGIIDGTVFHFAGDPSAYADDPWYDGVYYGSIGGTAGSVQFRGIVQVADYATTAECKMIEICCHELLHALGMPDLYSNDEEYLGIDPTTDIMSGQEPAINPYLKMLLGWVDTVQVITTDTANVRLNVYGDNAPGDFAIVTDQYDGLFSEFYLVAYRHIYDSYTAVIWHIDARLNESGTAFLNQNLTYSPRPDKGSAHGETSNRSKYLFIEELSADPSMDFVLNKRYGIEYTAFKEDSVFGVNSMPSSDTHDGRFTGIQIRNFKEHNNRYLTFDVSFIKDTAAPVIVTDEEDLDMKNTVKLKFNEYIYPDTNWGGVKVTDLDGNPLKASILIPHYPRNEVEITFADSSYENGYKILFPKGAIRDSSGNAMDAVTLSTSTSKTFFPKDSQSLPQPEDHYNPLFTYYFPEKDSFVVINSLVKVDTPGMRIEFTRLDYKGNLLCHNAVENPLANSQITYVEAMGNGSFLLICRDDTMVTSLNDRMFCLDAQGNIKWVNEEYHQSGKSFTSPKKSIVHEQGLIIGETSARTMVLVNAETGKIQDVSFGSIPTSFLFFNPTFDLGNGTVMYTSGGLQYPTWLYVFDKNTFEMIAEAELPGTSEGNYSINQVCLNPDGSLLLHASLGTENRMFLLDAKLNVRKSIPLATMQNGQQYVIWMGQDGFCDVVRTAQGGHDNSGYHVVRYDRSLNTLWKTDIECHDFCLFRAPSGEIIAHRYIYQPQHMRLIDFYGSEEDFRPAHTHNLVFNKEIPATCQKTGTAAHWYCAECGQYFSDKGKTAITDPGKLVLPKIGHKEQILPAVAATCAQTGKTEGKMCADCGQILLAQQTVAKLAHTEEHVPEIPATCTEPGKTAGVRCSICKAVLSGLENIPAKNHDFGPWTVIKEATAQEEGLQEQTCKVCGQKNQRPIDKLGATPTEPLTPPTEPSQPAIPPQPTKPTQATVPSQPAVQTDPTTDATEPDRTEPEPGDATVLILLICAAVVIGAGGAGAALLIKKKKG